MNPEFKSADEFSGAILNAYFALDEAKTKAEQAQIRLRDCSEYFRRLVEQVRHVTLPPPATGEEPKP